MTELEKMLKGELYLSSNEDLTNKRLYARKITNKYNKTKYHQNQKRNKLLKKLIGSLGENPTITPTFNCDYGFNIKIGDNFYCNFDCIFLDVNEIIIGNNVMFGPRVNLFTATHPTLKDVRNKNLEYGLKIIIKDNVWIGGNTTINPGVTIGENSIIGSHSLVTKDVPPNVIAGGVPAKVIREITKEDYLEWKKKEENYYKGK